MPSLHQITPFFTVLDLDATVQFLQHGLAFKLWVRYDDFAYLQRDEVGIRLLRREDATGREHAYIEVQDVDALWAEFRSRLTTELSNNPDGPCDQTYGQREFTVLGPGNIMLFFGQAIFRDEPAWERARGEQDPPPS